MSRQRRIHVDGGVYYIVQQGSTSQSQFSAGQNFSPLSNLVGELLPLHEMRSHALCALKDSIHIALQVKSHPVASFMDDFKALYAKQFNRLHGCRGPLWNSRYRAMLIDPRAYLTKLVHYIHYLPQLKEGTPFDTHASSTHPAYIGTAVCPWLTTTVVMSMLGDRRSRYELAYRELMAQPPTEQEIHDFENGSPHDSRVLGGPVFLRSLPQEVVPYRTVQTLDDVIAVVALNHGLSIEELYTRKQSAVIARAVITWHATTRDIATLSTVARRFNREPQTLYESMHLHRNSKPELFELSALRHQATPIVARFQENSFSENDLRDLDEDGADEHEEDDSLVSTTRASTDEESLHRKKFHARRLVA